MRRYAAFFRSTAIALTTWAATSFAQTTNYFVNFEGTGETKTSYASGTVTLSGLQWNLTEALIGTDANDRKNGSRAARMRTNDVAVMTMLEDITAGAGVVTFLHGRYGSDNASFVALDYSTNGGSAWVNAGTASVSSTTLQQYSTNINVSGNIRFRLRKTGSTPANARANVDDFTVLASGPPVDPPTNVQFTAPSASISEAGGAYTVTVFKTLASGNVSGSVALGGTAANPADYTINTTNFTMNGAVTSATFVISIDDDGIAESNETVTLTLTNVTGGTIASPSIFTLTINDNDAPPASPEGILSFRFNTPPYLTVTTNEPGITVSIMSLTSGTIETNITTGTYFPDEPYIEETGGWTNSTQAGAKAFQFTVTPDVATTITITGISFRAYATAAGPSAFGASIDGFSVFTANMPDSALQTVSNSFPPIIKTTPFVVSIEGWTNGSRATSGAGVFRLDDVVLFGVIAAGSAPTNVQFTASSATVDESVGSYTVTVTKSVASGNVSGNVGLSGTATNPADYTINTTNFTMNGATTSATFIITVDDDAIVEPTETVVLTINDVVGGTLATPFVFTLSITNNDTLGPAPSTNIWINELHYDNTGTDVDEGVEIAGPAGIDLTGYSLWLYDGGTSCFCAYSNQNLTGVIPNQSNGVGTLWFPTPSIQNGPDGVALVYNSTQVIQFLSYEGSFTVTNGPAAGLASVDIGVSQPGTGPVGHSLQLCGSGTNYAAFTWTTNTPHSRGAINACQSIPSAPPYGPAQTAYIIAWWGSIGAYTGNAADDDGDGFSNLEEFIAGTIPVPPSGATNYFRAIQIAITNAPNTLVSTPSVTGRLYRLWSTPTLAPTQSWSQVAGPIAGSGGTLALTNTAPATTGVFRLTVELENP